MEKEEMGKLTPYQKKALRWVADGKVFVSPATTLKTSGYYINSGDARKDIDRRTITILLRQGYVREAARSRGCKTAVCLTEHGKELLKTLENEHGAR